MSEPLRRAPFAVVFFAKTVITTLLIVVAYGLGGLVLFPNRFATASALPDLARDTGFALAVAGVFQLLVMVRNLIGGRVLTNIVLGRYHRPLSEERIFMFVDVTGSTALAERAGAIGAYSMISRFFFDVAQETVRFAGETHAYIGDAVIVTWPLQHGLENARCLRCYFGICDRIRAKSSLYQRDFGVVPRFRVGVHGGPVVAGECGDDKRQIVYFGDTINTAARIQEACKVFDRTLLLSGELVGRMALLPGYRRNQPRQSEAPRSRARGRTVHRRALGAPMNGRSRALIALKWRQLTGQPRGNQRPSTSIRAPAQRQALERTGVPPGGSPSGRCPIWFINIFLEHLDYI